MSAAGLFASIRGTRIRKKADKALDRELANAPKYQITEEAFANQAMAQSDAFGRDRSIQMAQEDTAQTAANTIGEARNVTNSTSALLQTLATINQSRNQQLRGLAQDEAVLMNQKRQQLYGANTAMIDERDKAWNYNQNMPFQMRVAKYRDQAKVGSEMELAGVAAQAQTEAAFASSLGSMGSMMGGSDERIKRNIKPMDRGIDEVMKIEVKEYQYKPEYIDDSGQKHVGVMAQNLQEVLPEAVSHNGNYFMVDYAAIVPLLLKGMQDQQHQIEELKNTIKELQPELASVAV